MLKSLVAVLALVIGLSFGAVTFVQADEKAPAPAGSAAPVEKKDMGGEKKDTGEKKAEKKVSKKKKDMGGDKKDTGEKKESDKK